MSEGLHTIMMLAVHNIDHVHHLGLVCYHAIKHSLETAVLLFYQVSSH